MDNKFFDIVYFGNDWFGENRTSSHHIAEQLSKNNRVLYVECPGLRMPKSNKRDLKKLFKKLLKCFSLPKKINNNFYVYTLFQIPLHRYSFIKRLNGFIVPLFVKLAMFSLKVDRPILWFMLPHLAMVPGHLNERSVVYYCIDDYSALPGVDKTAIATMDEKMTRIADLVFVASLPLFERKKSTAKKLFLSPHGVDFDLFNQSFGDALETPQDVKELTGPVVGFWGSIENWIDLELVAYLARENTTWNIVMIGHVSVSKNPCDGLANVHFLGPKKFVDLPAYAKIFDVAILPYLLNEQVYNCNPIKLREYLATGTPIVSVRYPEVENYSDIVSIADGYDDFDQKVKNALDSDSKDAAFKRIERVRNESWDSRVQKCFEQVTYSLI